jgi:hypothetical protein
MDFTSHFLTFTEDVKWRVRSYYHNSHRSVTVFGRLYPLLPKVLPFKNPINIWLFLLLPLKLLTNIRRRRIYIINKYLFFFLPTKELSILRVTQVTVRGEM